MAGDILYLDVDDEITSAAARIRSITGRRAAIVIPHGSRVATSRINFRLLARDAQAHEKDLAIVAGDAATRALAASAGLPVFASVAEYEAEVAAERLADTAAPASAAEIAASTHRGPDEADRVALEGSETVVTAASVASAAGPRVVPGPALPDGPAPAGAPTAAIGRPARTATARTGPSVTARTPLLVGLGVVALAVLVGSVGAFLLLPAATIVVTPREEAIGPISMRIIADPEATAVDVDRGIVPARTIETEVVASGAFPATGERVEETTAEGEVRFRNKDFTASEAIPKGAVVSTASGVRFRTNRAITIPAAELVGLQVFPATATVAVTAVEPGTEGNVEANTILTIPRGEDPLTLDVTNPDPTSGGQRETFARISQEDVDGAMASLQTTLQDEFAARLDDPDLAGPAMTVFPETAVLGLAVPSVDPATLVDQEVETFDLELTATGRVTAVDAAPIRSIAEARLTSSVDADHELVTGSSEITEAPAVVDAGVVTFPVVATARQIAILDPDALRAEILGLPVDDARAALGAYGTVQLETWPGWVGTIPTIDARVDLTIDGPVAIAGPSPSPSDP